MLGQFHPGYRRSVPDMDAANLLANAEADLRAIEAQGIRSGTAYDQAKAALVEARQEVATYCSVRVSAVSARSTAPNVEAGRSRSKVRTTNPTGKGPEVGRLLEPEIANTEGQVLDETDGNQRRRRPK